MSTVRQNWAGTFICGNSRGSDHADRSHTYVESAYTGKFGGPYHPAVYVIGPLP